MRKFIAGRFQLCLSACVLSARSQSDHPMARCHRLLASYFLNYTTMDRKLVELPWHLDQAREREILCEVLCKPRWVGDLVLVAKRLEIDLRRNDKICTTAPYATYLLFTCEYFAAMFRTFRRTSEWCEYLVTWFCRMISFLKIMTVENVKAFIIFLLNYDVCGKNQRIGAYVFPNSVWKLMTCLSLICCNADAAKVFSAFPRTLDLISIAMLVRNGLWQISIFSASFWPSAAPRCFSQRCTPITCFIGKLSSSTTTTYCIALRWSTVSCLFVQEYAEKSRRSSVTLFSNKRQLIVVS